VPPFAADPRDTHLLALATTATADYLVTGDYPLQELGSYGKTQIVSPRDFLALLEANT
jgi:predicted nucleic acid-binding protein